MNTHASTFLNMAIHKSVRPREIYALLRLFGYEFVRNANGSHEMWKHVQTGQTLTITRNLGDPRAIRNLCAQLARRERQP